MCKSETTAKSYVIYHIKQSEVPKVVIGQKKLHLCKICTLPQFLIHSVNYCESILFRGAEISSFEDDGHVRGYLTSWIAIPTKLKTYKIISKSLVQLFTSIGTNPMQPISLLTITMSK